MSWRNEADWDRLVRVAMGIAMLVLGWGAGWPEPLSAALKIFAVVPLVTGLMGWCPLYTLLGVCTKRGRK